MKSNESIRLFKNPLLESLTHVHPIIPLLLWTPVVGHLYWLSIKTDLSFISIIAYSAAGFITWTLMEYLIHRFFFHFNAKTKAGQYIVYLFHGIHHDSPMDKTRLVMPPAPGILLAGALFIFFKTAMGAPIVYPFFAGFLIAYLCYDYIHYAIHHFNLKSSIGKKLRRHHLIHHVHDDKMFGVSSPLWDVIFRSLDGDSSN